MLNFGLPSRMNAAICAVLSRGEAISERKLNLLEITTQENVRVRLDASQQSIITAGDQMARRVYAICHNYATTDEIKNQVRALCKEQGVSFPVGETDTEILKRALDKVWWVRNISKEHKRRLEHASIELGFTSKDKDAYISQEVALIQKRKNAANRKLLENTKVSNGTDEFTLAQLSDLSTANKTLRRGELMTRIRGFEEVATELNHVAMFFTITCPSKYHSVGGTNEKYNGATPRQAQKYLCKIWARMRAEIKRRELIPYGFRIAEPHTDGCPHWHMLFFVDRKDAPAMEQVIKHYSMREDGDEKGAAENRFKLIHIETGNGKSAAGYIAKYISKNIDGFGVGNHLAFENGETYTIQTDLLGNEELTASQRVTYWSQVWGIRQFQQIGGAPIGVWRELRRVPEDATVIDPETGEIKGGVMSGDVAAAWRSCQKTAVSVQIPCDKSPDGTKTITQASFADYLRAQGGAQTGRAYKVRIAYKEVKIEGKYATYEAKKPFGIYAQSEAETIYKSKRYVWTRVDAGNDGGVAVAFGVPRTGVNNCTVEPYWVIDKKAKNKNFSSSVSDEEIKRAIERDKKWDLSRRYDEKGFLKHEHV